MTSKKVSFEEFVSSQELPKCAMCVLPERGEIDGVYRKGKSSKKQVTDYLWNVCGYADKTTFDDKGKVLGISATAVEKHYTQKHHYDSGVTNV